VATLAPGPAVPLPDSLTERQFVTQWTAHGRGLFVIGQFGRVKLRTIGQVGFDLRDTPDGPGREGRGDAHIKRGQCRSVVDCDVRSKTSNEVRRVFP